jgi:hypothetical protein
MGEISMTTAECLAILADCRATARCRRCECLDWALAQLQQAGDYDLAYRAVMLRVRPEVLEELPICRPCVPVDAVLAWLRLPVSSTPDDDR